MQNKINIGFLGNQIAPGGGSTSLLLTIKALDKSKFRIFVISSECVSKTSLEEFKKIAEVVEVNNNLSQIVSCAGHKTTLKEWLKAISTVKKQVQIIIDFINLHKIQILHINNSVFSHIYSDLRKNTSAKIVTHIREQVDLYRTNYFQNKIIHNIGRNSHRLITISDNESRAFKEYDPVMIPNPFDFSIVENIEPLDFKQKHGIDDNYKLVAMMGRFAKDKGHLIFLKAAEKVLKKEPSLKVKFVILGVNSPKPKLKRFIKKILFKIDYSDLVNNFIKRSILKDHLALVPYTSNIIPLVKSMDIMVRPSLTGDPWGRDIIESMACKKPVIASGSYDLFIKNEITGLLVEPGNINQLSDIIIKIIKDGKLQNTIAERAFLHVNELCNMPTYAKNLEKIYNQLLSA